MSQEVWDNSTRGGVMKEETGGRTSVFRCDDAAKKIRNALPTKIVGIEHPDIHIYGMLYYFEKQRCCVLYELKFFWHISKLRYKQTSVQIEF
jgi:hypothetical protein